MPDLSVPTTTAPQTQTQTHSHLLTLPLELHHLITSHLSTPAYLALRLAHPHFYHALPTSSPHPSTQPLDSCARLAIRTYLAPYLQERRGSCGGASTAKNKNGIRTENATANEDEDQDADQDRPTRCALCGQLYPQRLFSSTASPACTTQDFSNTTTATTTTTTAHLPHHRHREILDLPDRVCAWHVGRLTRTATLPTPQPQQPQPPPRHPRWTSRTEPMCMHCGVVTGWRACRCACSTCGVRTARTYTRWVEAGSGEVVGGGGGGVGGAAVASGSLRGGRIGAQKGSWRCVGFVFWRDTRGGLWVRERRARIDDDDAGECASLFVCVLFAAAYCLLPAAVTRRLLACFRWLPGLLGSVWCFAAGAGRLGVWHRKGVPGCLDVSNGFCGS
ncbi:uncharacterized protein K452DRAFT_285300 [Aplosporella prunicola CBS 121167]|uniref:Uncharacterized protein n=1 Tax=Aplosporella prunicola CBS 121167 TaxID=1176127 RepID=A0A6A6BJ87_9PEZI|nr:uncharacterized protein K452DRAFT_285300 [Aplosporella prunicola CBS 121167]KAF2144086.1 hypothetical protein K452DRAFT_285300 [Aplosporella prunicola CBS 121167]